MDQVNEGLSTTPSPTDAFSVPLSSSSPPVSPLCTASDCCDSSPSSLMRSSSLPILPSTTWESFEGLEISETKPPPGTDVKETMEKASLAITSTLLSDTTTLLPLTSSAPVCETLVVDPLTTSSNPCAFESPSRFEVLGDVDEVVTEPSSSLSLTRGGRETKLPIKYQDMEWKTIRERGKRGRRGRGSYH
ncbi:hypothetical protein F2Q68_00017834 [Brassica cretica]|uniref:Uncharacterized protein n=1 Tax=Brassica cretica TaxID=69181 RepID=A0A8S9HGS1_BRACR|nr:hypothetical protein F2Q68_00017834 [Brassica cretica]